MQCKYRQYTLFLSHRFYYFNFMTNSFFLSRAKLFKHKKGAAPTAGKRLAKPHAFSRKAAVEEFY